MRVAKIYQAREKIENFFSGHHSKVFRQSELSLVLQTNKTEWDLPKTQKLFKFIDFMKENSSLNEVVIAFANGSRIHRYAWGDVSIFEIFRFRAVP